MQQLSSITLAVTTLALAACSLAARPIPPATSHDPALEAEAMRAYPYLKDTLGMTPGGAPIAARIVSGWDVAQNEYTGAPTKRYVEIVVVAKDDDGTCHWTKGSFSQRHMGGGTYGELLAEHQLAKGAVDCKSIEEGGTKEKSAGAPPASNQGIAVVSAGSPEPAETDAEYAAKVEKIVESLGDDAVEECQTYIREMCKRQKGSTRVTVCRTYADYIRPSASSAQGATICQAGLDALPK